MSEITIFHRTPIQIASHTINALISPSSAPGPIPKGLPSFPSRRPSLSPSSGPRDEAPRGTPTNREAALLTRGFGAVDKGRLAGTPQGARAAGVPTWPPFLIGAAEGRERRPSSGSLWRTGPFLLLGPRGKSEVFGR